MLTDLLMWNKIGRIVVIIAHKLSITTEEALDIFYTSPVCDELHDPSTALYLMGDQYIANNVINLVEKQMR